MTELEISKALALAIGWKESRIKVTDAVFVWRGYWCIFDYRDWNVIGPIAERYNCFPSRNGLAQLWWPPQVVGNRLIKNIMEDTPQKAIAMAVIERAKHV